LAEKHKNSFGIASDVEKFHREFAGKKAKDCINEVVEAFQKLSTMKGVFFEVSVPVKSDIFSVIPWNKMEHRWFGINANGVYSIDRNSGEVGDCHRVGVGRINPVFLFGGGSWLGSRCLYHYRGKD
jgi:hypothetical protein